jgi:hypothetical protein
MPKFLDANNSFAEAVGASNGVGVNNNGGFMDSGNKFIDANSNFVDAVGVSNSGSFLDSGNKFIDVNNNFIDSNSLGANSSVSAGNSQQHVQQQHQMQQWVNAGDSMNMLAGNGFDMASVNASGGIHKTCMCFFLCAVFYPYVLTCICASTQSLHGRFVYIYIYILYFVCTYNMHTRIHTCNI